MSLAAILTPQQKDEALVFSYQGKSGVRNLVVQQFNLNEPEDPFTALNHNTRNIFSVHEPALAVARFDRQVRVFGIATYDENRMKEVVQLSPVFTPINKKEYAVSPYRDGIAACGNPKDRSGYVYFLSFNNVATLNYTTLAPTSSVSPITSDICDESRLAAVYREGKPWIFYQDKKKLIHVRKNNERAEKISTADSAKEGCYLSALNLGKLDGEDCGVALCYENKTGGVSLVKFTEDWSAEKVVLVATEREKESGFSLVGEKNQVHLFYWLDQRVFHRALDMSA